MDGTGWSDVRIEGVLVGVEYRLGNVESNIRESVDGDEGKGLLSKGVPSVFIKSKGVSCSGSGILFGYMASETRVGATAMAFTGARHSFPDRSLRS